MGLEGIGRSKAARPLWPLGIGVALVVFGAVLLAPTTPARAQPDATPRAVLCDRILENFGQSKVGSFPAGWRTKEASDMAFAEREKLFSVERDGNRNVLHVVYREKAVTIGKGVSGWDLDQYPMLQYQWKAIKLPRGGDESSIGSNDAAASVYVFWDIGFPFQVDSIKYTWSSTLKVGSELKKRLGHDFVRVMESGSQSLGQWRTVRVDVRADYLRAFGKDKATPANGVALLSDADATKSEAEAYYADFRLCRYR